MANVALTKYSIFKFSSYQALIFFDFQIIRFVDIQICYCAIMLYLRICYMLFQRLVLNGLIVSRMCTYLSIINSCQFIVLIKLDVFYSCVSY